jgi:hypothetical protein
VLTPEQEAAVHLGFEAEALMQQEVFDRLAQRFNMNCARAFLTTPVTREAEENEELRRARLSYLGFQDFLTYLKALSTSKDELLALQDQQHNERDTL